MDKDENKKSRLVFGIFTIKELIALLILAGTIFMNVALGYYQLRGLPEQVNRNSGDISELKEDFIKVEINQNYVREKQTIMHEDLKEVQRDIKVLLTK